MIQKIEIFEEKKGSLKSKMGSVQKNDEEKIFKIINSKIIKKSINDEINIKYILEAKLRQNCILFYEEDESTKSKISYKKDWKNFINSHSNDVFYFDKDFDCPNHLFYKIIKNKIDILDIENEKLKYIMEGYIDNRIKKLLKPLYDDLLNDNWKKKIKCKYCNNENNYGPLFYNIKNKESEYFHEKCYNKFSQAIQAFTFKNIDQIFHKIKLNIYNDCKNKILNSETSLKKVINKFFSSCEARFNQKE